MATQAPLDTPSPVRTDFESLTGPLLPHLERLDLFLESQIDAFEPEIREMVAYALGSSGKRIRSMLLFYSGWTDAPEIPDDLIKAAAVIELVHLATLVHDDILDDAEIRHKRPTISQKFGASAAVLFGDALFGHALKLAAEFSTVEVCRTVSLATRRVCAGEIKQNFLRGNPRLSLEEYFRIIELKTAELFWSSCRLGAYLAGAEASLLAAVELFGRHLGVAYQIYDDVADLMGDESTIGKTLGTDLQNGNFTLPLLLLFEEAGIWDRAAFATRLAKDPKMAEPELFSFFHKFEILPKTIRYFDEQLEAGSAALVPLPPTPAIEKLLSINAFIRQQMDRLSAIPG